MDNSYISVIIEGKNINNYIKWLIKQKIHIINLNVIRHNKLEVTIKQKDFDKLSKYSRTYKVKVTKTYGILKIIEILKKNSFIFVTIIIAILFVYFLSNIIFSIEIVYNNPEIVNKMKKELKKHNIKKYQLKKDYENLEKIKKEILDNNKDTLEWLEIIENGTKYIVKLVERKKEDINKEYEYQSITVTKDAIVTNIKALSGEKIKEINDYVKKDDVVVSGIITKPDNTLIYTKAKATIYGEVWYKVDIEYPYAYQEERVTGKSKNVFVIKFLNKKIPVFSYKKYKEFKTITNNIVEHNILPINLSKEKQYEVIIKEEIYTWEEAISNAIQESKKKMLESNKKIIEIKNVDILDKQAINTKIKLSLFVSVIEDITKVIEVKKIEIEETKNDLQN